MRTKWVVMTAVAALTAMPPVHAQTPKRNSDRVGGDAMSRTYTGCVESFNHGAAFLLTKVHDSEPSSGRGTTAPLAWKAFALAGSSELNKQVGHTVSVTGPVSDRSTAGTRQDVLTVKSLKVIAESCS